MLESELDLVRYQKEIKIVKAVLELVVSSHTIEGLCRRFVHDDFTLGIIEGSHVYSINSSLDLIHEIGYGKSTEIVKPITSVWEDGSPISRCVKEKTPIFIPGSKNGHLGIPLLSESVPVACLLLVMSPACSTSPISTLTFEILSKIGAFFVESKPTKDYQKLHRTTELISGKLTVRQIKILKHASEGLTNAAIGRLVSVSESTVRQETIRIYRTLGASGRLEAIAKAKIAGIISA